MPTLYLHILDSLADWEPGHVLAELRSGRYLKDPAHRYNVLTCGRSMVPITTMGGLHLSPDILVSDIQPSAGDVLLLPGGIPGWTCHSSRPSPQQADCWAMG